MFHLFGRLDHLPCRLKNRVIAEGPPEFDIKIPARKLAFSQACLPGRFEGFGGWLTSAP
jgi:hypothetical protein